MSYQPKEFRWWYDAIIDWMLANPDKSLRDCARDLGRTPEYIRIIAKTDLFRQRYAERRAEINDHLALVITDRAGRVGAKALDLMLERLESEETNIRIPTDILISMADKTLQHLGYGGRVGAATGGAAVTVNLTVGREVLENARQKMREIEAHAASLTRVGDDAPALKQVCGSESPV